MAASSALLFIRGIGRFSRRPLQVTHCGRKASSIEKLAEGFSAHKIATNSDVPKPYLDETIYKLAFRKNRRIYTTRALAEWKNDNTSGENWPEVWNAPAPFNPHKVPLDVRMGAEQNMVPKPGKYGNLELMKVQNFLHLTPPAIHRHCEELRKFCTEWPEELKTDEECENHFPVEIYSTDYAHAGQSQRNSKARITTLKIRLCNLTLDHHARHKMIKMAAERYDPKTDMLTIVADRCPVRKQNREYLDYLLTVLYYESWKVENWESHEFVSDEDEVYWWNDSTSYKSMIEMLKHHPVYSSYFAMDESEKMKAIKPLEDNREVKAYCDAVCRIKLPPPEMTENERKEAMLVYKNSVRTLLKLPEL